MKTVDIKGKKYVEVNERIKYFRNNYKDYSLISEIVSIENGICIIKASILDEKRNVIANGIAYEKEGSSFINKTSYIENAETSAWGRALGNFGIGIDASIASADEVGNAIKQQGELPKGVKKVKNVQEMPEFGSPNKLISQKQAKDLYKKMIDNESFNENVFKAWLSNEYKIVNTDGKYLNKIKVKDYDNICKWVKAYQ